MNQLIDQILRDDIVLETHNGKQALIRYACYELICFLPCCNHPDYIPCIPSGLCVTCSGEMPPKARL